MTKLLEHSEAGHDELIFPCACHTGHYLRITWDDDPEWRYLWLEGVYDNRTLRCRFRAIWRSLTGREVAVGEMALTEESVTALRFYLAQR